MNGGKSFYLLEKYALFSTQKTSGRGATTLFKATRQTGRGKPNTGPENFSQGLGSIASTEGSLTGSSGLGRLDEKERKEERKVPVPF